MASFRNIYTSLMLVIARSTQKELARRVSYLKVENQILRSRLPDRISLTQREKNRLVRFAKNHVAMRFLFEEDRFEDWPPRYLCSGLLKRQNAAGLPHSVDL